MLHLGSIGQKQDGWFLHTGLLWDRNRLAKTWHNQPERNRTRAGFAQLYPGCLWKHGTESESGKLVAGRLRPGRNWARWFLHTSFLPDQMHLAKPWPGHSDQIRVSFAPYDPSCLIWKIQNWNGCGKSDLAYMIRPNSGCTLAVTSITGHNQNAFGSDPTCLLGS